MVYWSWRNVSHFAFPTISSVGKRKEVHKLGKKINCEACGKEIEESELKLWLTEDGVVSGLY